MQMDYIQKPTLNDVIGSSIAEKPERTENGSAIKPKGGLADDAKLINENVRLIADKADSIDKGVRLVHEDTDRMHDLNTEICGAYLKEDGTPRDFSDREGRDKMNSNIERNTSKLGEFIAHIPEFFEKLVQKIPESVDAKIPEEQMKVIDCFNRNRALFIGSFVFLTVALGFVMGLYVSKTDEYEAKLQELNARNERLQEFANWGNFMKETNPKTWAKWENGEIRYTTTPGK